MKLIASISYLAILVLSTGGYAAESKSLSRWAAYSKEAPWTEFTQEDVLAFSPVHHPQLRPLKGWGKTVFARLLFTADATSASAAADVYSLAEVENPKEIKKVLERDIPELVRTGFDGVVLDMDHRERDLLLGSKISVLMNLLHIHYPYLRVMVSLPYEHLFEDYGAASDLLISFNGDDTHLSNEEIKSTIENIKNLSKLKPQHHVWVAILSDAPNAAQCLAFIDAGLSCHANNYAWTYQVEKQ